MDKEFRSNKPIVLLYLTLFWLFFLTVILLYVAVFLSLMKRIRISVNQTGEKRDRNLKAIQLRAVLMLFDKTVIFGTLWIPFWFRSIKGYVVDSTVEHVFFVNSSISCYIYLIFNGKFERNIISYLSKK